MKVIAAYLLALLGGNSNPKADDIKKILASVDAEADDKKISHLLSELEGKDVLEVILEGKEKFASVPSGGAGVAVAASAGAAAPAAAEGAKEAPKEEEPAAEESEEEMGMGLFGDDDEF